ncbi:hypothetical protein EDC52_10415 [Biostraticola tofi]|uniref:Uncharacterized protein n=1 Tax=Biostraticola tofi TaxID=466109 RepID=A0A4R3YU37_9GAMM|nr:hypothetical protein EDC52_10415 [Biostraticola tofi]
MNRSVEQLKESHAYKNECYELLCELAANQIDSPDIDEFNAAGSDRVNNFLRDINQISMPADATDAASAMLDIYEKMQDFPGRAYRVMTTAAGVYGAKIGVGDIVMDKGFMSASALPVNCLDWKNSWVRKQTAVDSDMVILIIESGTPKKNAGSAFLPDHILVKPNTLLRVENMLDSQDDEGHEIKIISLSHGWRGTEVKNIFSGEVY